MWRLFNSPTTLVKTCKYVIQDERGHTTIDEDYKEMGVSEGWLTLHGWRETFDRKMIWIYRIK